MHTPVIPGLGQLGQEDWKVRVILRELTRIGMLGALSGCSGASSFRCFEAGSHHVGQAGFQSFARSSACDLTGLHNCT